MAVLTITFAGFSALLLGIRQAAGVQSSPLDRYLAQTGLTQLFTLTAGALFPALLFLYGVSENWLWRVSAVVFGVPMLTLLLTYPYWQRSAADCFCHLRRIGLGSDPSDACLDLDRISASARRLYLRPVSQFFYARFRFYRRARCDHARTDRQTRPITRAVNAALIKHGRLPLLAHGLGIVNTAYGRQLTIFGITTVPKRCLLLGPSKQPKGD